MRKNILFIITTVVVLLATGCKTLKMDAPKESYLPSNLSPAVSELPLQAEIDVKKLETAVNKKVAGLLYEGNNINNQDLSIKVWKVQNFSFNINNNVIEYRVPLKIWSKFAWNVQKFGISIGDHYEANGSIALNFRTTISIDKNWKLVAKTVSAGYQWIETPKLNVIGVNVPVTPIANYALEKSQSMITDQIDQALAQMVELKKYVQMAWDQIQKPMQVNADNNLWIRITPKDMYVSPFTTSGQKLYIGMSMNALIESFMGAQPQTNKPIAVPSFKNVPRISKNFNLNVAADVTFEKITEMSREQLLNKTFSEGKKSITITGISIYGSEGKAVFVADVKGSIKGRIYFTGNLIYNPEKMTVEVQNPEFDVNTKNALVKSAGWLLHGLILNKLTPYMSYPVKSYIDDMKKQANDLLKNYKVYDGILLNGNISSMTVNSLNLVSGAVRINANAKGSVSLSISDLNL
jgi:hypothetical protein